MKNDNNGRPDQGRAAASKAEQALRRAASIQDRRGEKVTHPDDNHEAQQWLKNIENCVDAHSVPQTGNPGTGAIATCAVAGFVESDAFRVWNERGREGKSGHYEIPAALIRSNAQGLQGYRENTVNVGTVADLRAVLATDYQPGIRANPSRFTRIEDLHNVLPTDASAIHYLRQTAETNNAGTIAENTDPDSVETVATSNYTVTQQSKTIRKISHKVEFPIEMLEDMPLLVAFLQSRMESGVDDEKDNQFLHGDGTGSNILGYFNDSEVTEYQWSTGETGDNRADAYLLALAELWNTNYMADGISMSFSDWVQIIMMKDNQNRYLFPQAHMRDVAPTLWTLPVATSAAHTYGQGLVGAFGDTESTYIADRQRITMRMTDSHASRFAENILTMLVEWRGALIVGRPAGFRQVSLNAAPSGSES